MRKSSDIKANIAELRAEVEAIVKVAESEKRELAADEQTRVDAILNTGGEIDTLQAQYDRALKIEAVQRENIRAALGDQHNQQLIDSGIRSAQPKVPATAKAVGKLRYFKNEYDAYSSGQFILATVMGNRRAQQWCSEHGMDIRNAMTTDSNTKGGYLVPEPLEAAIIELREEFGVFRRNAFVWPMGDGVALVPKLNGEVTVYFVGEQTAPTASDLALAQVKLEAKKLASLTAVSSELGEDAVISVAEMIARSIAQQFANKEDECGFNGDGTSTYGGIYGLANCLAAGSKVTATSETTFAGLTMGSFQATVAKLKRYAGIMPKWYISSEGYYLSMDDLKNAAGGNTSENLSQGSPPKFLGYDVVFTQVMTGSAGTITGLPACYFGDLRMSAYLGSRRGTSVVADESFYFSQDAVAIRGTQRFDINIHERGTATESGAIVALIAG